jgi:peptidoglycan-N-acetylglucosamine deacetylase
MTRIVGAVLAALVVVPLALASTDEGAVRRPHVPLAWEQHRAVARLVAAGEPVFCGGGRSNAVALTFDDGPGDYADRIVRILRANRAHATFFAVGYRVRERPAQLRELATVGVIGNHSWSHAHLPQLPRLFAWLDLVQLQHDTRAALGWKPRLFRAPYEERTTQLDRLVRRMGMLQVYWSVDSGDWAKGATARTVVRNVVPQLRPGAIVVLHEIHPWTIDALPEILRQIRLRGLRAVSVPELLALDPPRGREQCRARTPVP